MGGDLQSFGQLAQGEKFGVGQGRSDGGLGPGVLHLLLKVHEGLVGGQVVDGSDSQGQGYHQAHQSFPGHDPAPHPLEVSHHGIPVEVDVEKSRYQHDEPEDYVNAGPLVFIQSQEAPVCPVGHPSVGHDVQNDAREDEGNQRPQQKKAHIFSHFSSLLLCSSINKAAQEK